MRKCPTLADGQRVPSWDGVPLDVDVTLPPTGEGPFPTIAMLREPSATGADTLRLARRGYAVVGASARGFGRSCGVAGSRGAGCERGWTHVFDQRYEAHDVQHLLGILVDEGLARPAALGVAGEAGGGTVALELAFLHNRVRLPDGRFAAWRSPLGRRLSLAAAFAVRPAYDLPSALLPDGRFTDFAAAQASAAPVGVDRLAAVSALLSPPDSLLAPRGADPGADPQAWEATIERGEPYGAAAKSLVRALSRFHSAAGLTGTPAPLLIQTGWNDPVFDLGQALRPYNRLRERTVGAQVTLQVPTSAQPEAESRRNRFLDFWLRRRGTPPQAGSVLAWTQGCPGARRFVAASWAKLHPGAVRLASTRPQTVTSGLSAAAMNLGTCTPIALEPPSAGRVLLRRPVPAFTLLGRPTLTLRLRATGAAGQLVARLWDVDANATGRVPVARGVYRLNAGQRGDVTFQLDGAGHRFAAGHLAELELLGQEAAYRPSTGAFSAAISRLSLELPAHEKPSRARGITPPRFAADPAVRS